MCARFSDGMIGGKKSSLICIVSPHLAVNEELTEGLGLPMTQAASANQNVTDNIPHGKPKEWPSCLAHKLKHNNRGKDLWIPNKTVTFVA